MKNKIIILMLSLFVFGSSAFAVKVYVIDSTYSNHGTIIADIIRKQAPNADVRIIYISKTPEINAWVAAQAIYEAVNKGADIINLSFGGPDYSGALADAVDYAIKRGVIVVAAAGNDGGLTPNYPAALPGVISVGALDRNGNIANYSNLCADCFAPGDVALGLRGTSFAAPYVAGQIARTMTEKNLSATEAAKLVVGSPEQSPRIVGPTYVKIQDPFTFIPPKQILPDEEIWYELLALLILTKSIIDGLFSNVVFVSSPLSCVDQEPLIPPIDFSFGNNFNSSPVLGNWEFSFLGL